MSKFVLNELVLDRVEIAATTFLISLRSSRMALTIKRKHSSRVLISPLSGENNWESNCSIFNNNISNSSINIPFPHFSRFLNSILSKILIQDVKESSVRSLPQGSSALASSLLIEYTADIPGTKYWQLIYADDISLVTEHKDLSQNNGNSTQ